MTYKHKRGKCSKETKEILEDVLLAKEEEYGCIDCAETIRVKNPMEKVLKEETSAPRMKSQAEAIMEESKQESGTVAPAQNHDLESYQPPEEIRAMRENGAKEISEKEKKKRAYLEFKKDYK
ncbi:MAG: hypothetical protein ACFFED_10265 [Candidatus Thorarchaeota archaeon]